MGSVSIKAYLESLGMSVIEVGNNWNVDCPFCTDSRKRCGFHKETGQFHCFNCETKGSFKKFQAKVKDIRQLDVEFEKLPNEKKEIQIDQGLAAKYQERLSLKNRGSLKYLLEERGFKKETIDHFQLGSWKTKGHEYISIPFWEYGKLVNMKFRALTFTDRKWKWRRIAGGKSSLFHDDVCDQQWDTVFICEAELDAISLFNVGIRNVISVTTGAKGFKAEWYQRLEKFKKIYLVFDNDLDGQMGAEKMADRLGFDRCYNIVLPSEIKDANEYFWNKDTKKPNHTLDQFQKLIKDARKFSVRDAVTQKDALKDILKLRWEGDDDEIRGLQTPWRGLNKLIRGAKFGQLIVVTGKAKTGKTRFLLNWQRYLANQHEIVTGFYCCEMTPKELAEIGVAQTCNDFVSPDEITDVQIAETMLTNESERIIYGYPKEDELNLDNVCDWAKHMKQRYNMKWFVFDNLHFLVRGENVRDKIGEVTRRLKLLATTLNIVVVLVVHPRKGAKNVDMDDLKDSSSIGQDMDTMISLNRQEEESGEEADDTDFGKLSDLVTVYVKGRHVPGGTSKLYYHGARALFFESGELYDRAMNDWKDRLRKKQQLLKGRRR